MGSYATGVAWLPRRRALQAPAVLQALPASCKRVVVDERGGETRAREPGVEMGA